MLLLGVLMPSLLFIFSYSVQQKRIKKEVKKMMIAGIPMEDLVHFQFEIGSSTFMELKWEHSKEFEYQHKMFDIVKADTIGNMVYYVCFPDKQETALNLMFRKQLADYYNHNSEQQNKRAKIQNFISGFYLSKLQEVSLGFPSLLIFKIKYTQILNALYSEAYKGPPPQFS